MNCTVRTSPLEFARFSGFTVDRTFNVVLLQKLLCWGANVPTKDHRNVSCISSS